MERRPEVRGLLNNGVLRRETPDHDWALQLVQQAEETLNDPSALMPWSIGYKQSGSSEIT